MTTSNPPEEDGVDWAGLPGELLTCVSQLLSVPTSICFRAVCRSWREAADVVKQDRPAALTMPAPWVVIPGEIGCSRSFTLISVPTGQGFRWTPPGGAGLRCVGSNGGWLAGARIDSDRTVRVSLVNPLTDARVEAPPAGRVSFMPHPERHKSQIEHALSAAVQKVAFSPDPTEQDFAVAVVGVSRVAARASWAPAARFGVAFARAGCDGWCAFAELPNGCDRSARLDVAYRDGKFYYMTTCGQVWVVDMAAPAPAAAPLVRFPRAAPGGRGYHLAFSGDGTLHVVTLSTAAPHRASRLYMLAQRHDDHPSGGISDGSSPWTEVRLPGQAFLVSDFNQTLRAPVDGAWLRPNSVYFAGVPLICSFLSEYSSLRERGRDRVGVWRLDLVTGNFQRPIFIRKKRLRPPLDFWQPAWGRHKDDLLEEETCWNRLKLGLDWNKAIWLVPSMK